MESQVKVSWQSRLTNIFCKLMVRPFFKGENIQSFRKNYAAIDKFMSMFIRQGQINLQPSQFGSVSGSEYRQVDPNALVILYFHGGGYHMPITSLHKKMIGRLAETLNATVFVPYYRLGPEHLFPAAHNDCYDTYLWLLGQGYDHKKIVLIGDSVGGSIVLATLLRAKEEKRELPLAACCFSPMADFSFSSDSMNRNNGLDALMWKENVIDMLRPYGGENIDNAYLSPVLGDFRGIDNLLIHVSNTELMFDDSVRLAKSIEQVQGSVELKVWNKQLHAHVAISWLPESKQCLDITMEFVTRCLAIKKGASANAVAH